MAKVPTQSAGWKSIAKHVNFALADITHACALSLSEGPAGVTYPGGEKKQCREAGEWSGGGAGRWGFCCFRWGHREPLG